MSKYKNSYSMLAVNRKNQYASGCGAGGGKGNKGFQPGNTCGGDGDGSDGSGDQGGGDKPEGSPYKHGETPGEGIIDAKNYAGIVDEHIAPYINEDGEIPQEDMGGIMSSLEGLGFDEGDAEVLIMDSFPIARTGEAMPEMVDAPDTGVGELPSYEDALARDEQRQKDREDEMDAAIEADSDELEKGRNELQVELDEQREMYEDQGLDTSVLDEQQARIDKMEDAGEGGGARTDEPYLTSAGVTIPFTTMNDLAEDKGISQSEAQAFIESDPDGFDDWNSSYIQGEADTGTGEGGGWNRETAKNNQVALMDSELGSAYNEMRDQYEESGMAGDVYGIDDKVNDMFERTEGFSSAEEMQKEFEQTAIQAMSEMEDQGIEAPGDYTVMDAEPFVDRWEGRDIMQPDTGTGEGGGATESGSRSEAFDLYKEDYGDDASEEDFEESYAGHWEVEKDSMGREHPVGFAQDFVEQIGGVTDAISPEQRTRQLWRRLWLSKSRRWRRLGSLRQTRY